MIDEVDKIVNATIGIVGGTNEDILFGSGKYDVLYRDMICYIIDKYYPYLTNRFLDKCTCKKQAFVARVQKCEERIAKGTDSDLVSVINQVRKIVNQNGNKPASRPKKKDNEVSYKPSHKSHAKRLFGFEYTYQDDLRREAVIRASNLFMRDICRF